MFDFKAHAEVEDISAVPEEFRPLYVESADTPGTFGLNHSEPTIAGAIKALIGMSGALGASREAERKAKAGQIDLSPLSEFGTDVGSIREAVIAMQEELTNAKAGKIPGVDVDKLKAELAKAHATQLATKDQENDSLKSQLHSVLVDAALTSAIAEAKGNGALLRPMLASKIRPFFDDKGRMTVAVVDEAGDRRFSGVTGEHMTIAELVAETKADKQFAAAFESAALPGSGLSPDSPTAPKRTSTQQATDSVSLISRGLSKGLAKRERR